MFGLSAYTADLTVRRPELTHEIYGHLMHTHNRRI